MANSNNSVITGKFRGTIGKELVFREWDGKTVVAKAPKARTGPATAAQLKIQENFMLAAKYATSVMEGTDQGIRDAYAARLKPRQNLFSRAVADFMSPPVVKTIGTSAYNWCGWKHDHDSRDRRFPGNRCTGRDFRCQWHASGKRQCRTTDQWN